MAYAGDISQREERGGRFAGMRYKLYEQMRLK